MLIRGTGNEDEESVPTPCGAGVIQGLGPGALATRYAMEGFSPEDLDQETVEVFLSRRLTAELNVPCDLFPG